MKHHSGEVVEADLMFPLGPDVFPVLPLVPFTPYLKEQPLAGCVQNRVAVLSDNSMLLRMSLPSGEMTEKP